MQLHLFSALLTLAATSSAFCFPQDALAHFDHSQVSDSTGGKATCASGKIHINATAVNTLLRVPAPKNQFELTQFIVNYVQAGSTGSSATDGGNKTISSTYTINAKLCVPKGAPDNYNMTTVQLLTHGLGFDSYYWDISSPNNSYIDAAAEAGHTTFSYDRLGTGLSDHPDPLQVVQAPTEREILHNLVAFLRNGVGPLTFAKVVGVGHSYGAILTSAITSAYPKDFDAVILQGFSISNASQPLSFASFNPAIASEKQPQRFGNLSSGYFVVNSAIGDQMTFYHYPSFDPRIFSLVDAKKQPIAMGVLLTISKVLGPAYAFTGPVDVIDGDSDYIFCQANCSYPTDLAAQVLPALYRKAAKTSKHFLVSATGHGVNAHTTAPMAFQQMLGFVKDAGF